MGTIFERLREERLRLGRNQTEFGQIGGVQKGAQLKYESGERCPDGSYYAGIAAAGADVQYILTGVRSTSTLPADEMLLLERYRASPQAVKDAALRVVLVGSPADNGIVVHGNLGQQVTSPASGNFTVNMYKDPKKSK